MDHIKVAGTASRLVFSTLGRLYHLGACVSFSQPAGFGISTCTQRAMAPAAKLGCRRTIFFFPSDTPFMLVQFDPPSAEIDITTHRYTFLDVFLYVESIYDVTNAFRVH